MGEYEDDYRYSEEAQWRDLKILWYCDKCGGEREDYPGHNQGGRHEGCGGNWQEGGESYTA